MAYSLQSRDLIADGIETMMASQFYDANLAIPGCDKNMPGCVMAMGRVNRRAARRRAGTLFSRLCAELIVVQKATT